MVNTRELSVLIQEASTLSNKPNWSKQDERRNAWLLSAISAVKNGATLQEVDQERLNEVQLRNGLPLTSIIDKHALPTEQRTQAQLFRHFVRGERRDIEGAPMLAHIGTYTGLGYFVPTEFFNNVFNSLKAHDFLFDEDSVTMVRTANGRAITVPTMDDSENDASVITETGSQTSVDVAHMNQAELGVYSYASRRWTVSLEAFEDLPSTFSAMNLFQNFTSKALARGIGRDLVTGNGTGKPLGLLPSLLDAGCPVVQASGSAVNTGGAETGADSLGSQDFEQALSTLDPAYLNEKTAWAMNNYTLNSLRRLVNKVVQRSTSCAIPKTAQRSTAFLSRSRRAWTTSRRVRTR